MATNNRDAAIEKALTQVRRAKEAAQKEMEAQETMTQKLFQTGEIFGTAALATYLQLRFGVTTTPGVAIPISLLGGLGLNLASYFMEGSYSDHLRNIGDGLLASYGAALGATMAGVPRVAGVGNWPNQMAGGYQGQNYMPPAASRAPALAAAPSQATIAAIVQKMREHGWV